MTRLLLSRLMLLAVTGVVVGCGSSEPARISARGTVSLNGTPVRSGWIFFDPDLSQQTDGPQGFARIDNGHYDTRVGKGRGPIGGPSVVRIEGETETNGSRVLVEYSTTIDLPKTAFTQDFDLPTSAARKPQGPTNLP